MTIRILHGSRSTPVSVLRLGSGIYVAEGADGTHELTTVPGEYGGQTPVENPAAIEQATDGFPLLRCEPGFDVELDGLLDGSLRLEWSPNSVSGWLPFADADGHVLVPSATGLRKSVDWGTIDPDAIAAADVALRLAEYDASGTLIGTAWSSAQDWRVITGFKQVRLKAVVTRAGTDAIDPVITSVDVELAAFASAVGAPPSVEPPAITDPSDITELTHWFRWDVGVTLTGGKVSAWADQSGNGNDLAQATDADRPSPTTAEGNTPILFEPTQWLEATASPTGSWTISAMVALTGAEPSDHEGLCGMSDGGGGGNRLACLLRRNASADGVSYWDANNFWNESSYVIIRDAAAVVVTWVVDDAANSLAVYVEGTLVGSGTMSFSTPGAVPFGLGSTAGNGEGMRGYVGELVRYSGAKSAGDRAAIEEYLRNHWDGLI